MISLKEKTVIIQNFLPIDFVTLCDSATILPNSDRDSAEVMQIKTCIKSKFNVSYLEANA